MFGRDKEKEEKKKVGEITGFIGKGVALEGRVAAAVITGVVKGKRDAAVRVELRAPGKMTGEIKTPTLIIEEGVLFEGACTMVKKDGASFETVEYGSQEQRSTFVQ